MFAFLALVLCATPAAAQSVELHSGFGELGFAERSIVMVGYSAESAPLPAGVRENVEQAGQFALENFPRLFGVPREPRYGLRRDGRIQILDLKPSSAVHGVYFPPDDRSPGYVILSSSTLRNASMDRVVHTTLHEMFHAFVAASAWGRSGHKPPGWLEEGMGDAAGAYAFGQMPRRSERTLYVTGTQPQRGEMVGARPYDWPLYDMVAIREQGRYFSNESRRETPVDYYTSSFWRYLMRTSPRVLGHVLGTAPAGPGDADAVVALDRALKSFRVNGRVPWPGGLAQVLPAFISDFAEHPGREGYVQRRGAAGDLYAWPVWHTVVFRESGCTEIELGEGRQRWTNSGPPFFIRDLAARCLAVRVTYDDALPTPADTSTYYVSVEARAPVGSACRNLALSTRGKTVPALGVHRQAEGCRISWVVPYNPTASAWSGGAQPYILTNVDPFGPSTTRPVRLSLAVSLPTGLAEGSGGTSGADGSTPSTIPPTNARAQGSRGRPGRSRVPNAATARRSDPSPEQQREARASCSAERLAANLCGPQTQITLSLGERGGIAAAAVAGLARHELAQSVTAMMQPDAAGNVTMDGALAAARQPFVSVELSLPQIEPGFTGTVANAMVVAEWQDERGGLGRLDNRGPRPLVSRCTPGHPLAGTFAPSGSVTITYAGTDTIEGTFAATLYEDPPDPPGVCDIVRRPAGRVAGSFTTAAGLTFYDEPPEPVAEDALARLFDLLPPDMIGMVDYDVLLASARQGFEERARTLSRSAPATPPDVTGCTCSCDEVGTPDEARCAPLCGFNYPACGTDEPTEADLMALVRRLSAPMPAAVRASFEREYLEGFRAAPVEERRILMGLLRQMVAQYESD